MPDSITKKLWILASDDKLAETAVWPDNCGNQSPLFFTSRDAATRFLKSAAADGFRVDTIFTSDAIDTIFQWIERDHTSFYAFDPPSPQQLETITAAELLGTLIGLAENKGRR